jgi:hypothetical protein
MNQWVKPAQEPELPGLRELLRAMHQRIELIILLFFCAFCFISWLEYDCRPMLLLGQRQ